MGYLFFTFLVLLISIGLILKFPPDRMSSTQRYRVDLDDIWCAVNMCRTAGIGRPSIQICPYGQRTWIKFDFESAETVRLYIPLDHQKHYLAKSRYSDFFAERGLTAAQKSDAAVVECLTVCLDRDDENLAMKIVEIYNAVFDVEDGSPVSLHVTSLAIDRWHLEGRYNQKQKYRADYKFPSMSAQHKGIAKWKIQTRRILTAINLLAYPILIVMSYRYFGLTGMCWAGLAFVGFYQIYRVLSKKDVVVGINSLTRTCAIILFVAVLVRQESYFVQLIPSVSGFIIALISSSLALGILQPYTETDIASKKNNKKEYTLFASIHAFGGLGLYIFNEWARRAYDFDQWVWFFAFLRFEYVAVLMIVFIPILVAIKRAEWKDKT